MRTAFISWLRRGAAGAGVTVALAGCGELLDQAAPSRVLEETLQGASAAKLIVDGARASFGCVFQAYVTGLGLLVDELEDTQLAAAGWDWDRRTMLPVGGNFATATCDGTQQFGVYTPLQTARYTADLALTNLKGFADADVPDRQGLLATAALYSGYSHILLGEGFCSAAVDGGPELTNAQVFALAEGKFTEAIAAATTANNSSLLNAARVGRARARLNLAKLPGQAVVNAKLTEAKADAALVPAGFVYNVPYNSAATYSRNMFVVRNRESRLYGVAPRYWAMTFQGVPDPRVKVTQGARGQDNLTNNVYLADKYSAQNSPIALAKYAEARLIMAEADYHLVGPTAAVNYINDLHTAAGIPAFSSSDPTEILNQLIEERSRELFLESHRAYDVRRFNLPLDPAPGAGFMPANPNGALRNKGGQYGDVRCLPLPDVERDNNPNLAVAR
ncbi:MAG: RagB/SusD family nutrient uptake outer membrane protein [Gemmatimonadetes bacterium]|nr:RagB/SusD family nutrient uptake outer membrane protein [Gemmatimonadota bacterium]MCC7132999.1 RagB/SusD family nutrient uptake outer membrane protein [Gemmatimonadales bacterium]